MKREIEGKRETQIYREKWREMKGGRHIEEERGNWRGK